MCEHGPIMESTSARRPTRIPVLELVSRRVSDGSSSGIVEAIRGLIESGALPAETPLPTVREVAAALGVSTTTAHKAWRELQADGIVRTEGRRGSFVQPLPRDRGIVRWRQQSPTPLPHDLSNGAPDAQLLPELVFGSRETAHFRQSSYYGSIVVPELERAIRADWADAFEPEALTVVDGSLDALDRLLPLLIKRGDRVIVEDPTYPPIARMLEYAGAIVLPVPLDDDGPVPAAVASALRRGAAVLLFQPRAQNPTGVAITEARRDELADLLAPTDCWIIEHDSAGDVSSEPLITLADRIPDRTVRVHGFSKSHGPDLRLAAIGGPSEVVDELVARRHLGPAWSSRMLQFTLADLLTDPASQRVVETARGVYRARRSALRDALAAVDVPTIGRDGYNIWVPLTDPNVEPLALAVHGFGVASGAAFQLADDEPHCRITVATLPEALAPRIAGIIADAAGTAPDARLIRN